MLKRYVMMCGAALLLLPMASHAEETAATQETTLNLGLVWTEGNSDTLKLNASLLYEGKRENLGSVRAGIEANYGETKIDRERERDTENVSGFFNLRKTLTERTFGSVSGSALYDPVADIKYRFILSPAAGAILFKDERTEISAELGPAYIWEKVDDETDDYPALRLAQRLDYQISDTARLWQQVEYIPETDDFANYLLNSEIGISAEITARTSLRLVFQSRYDNTPADNAERHDVTVISGISMNL